MDENNDYKFFTKKGNEFFNDKNIKDTPLTLSITHILTIVILSHITEIYKEIEPTDYTNVDYLKLSEVSKDFYNELQKLLKMIRIGMKNNMIRKDYLDAIYICNSKYLETCKIEIVKDENYEYLKLSPKNI